MDRHPVILFDGVCNLCNRFVQFVIRHDREKQFRFASLQSVQGKALLAAHDAESNKLESVVLLKGDKLYRESSAALRVFRSLGGLWPALYIFMIVPAFIRNAVYRLVARNRYKIFGRSAECMLPSPELRERFLE